MVAVAVAVSGRNILTSAFVNCPWAIANATGIKGAYTIVCVVTNAIGISVCSAVTPTYTQGVELVSVTVTIASRNVLTSAFKRGPRTIANSALVQCTHTIVHVITNAIGIGVGNAVATTNAEHVLHIAITVASTLGDAITAANAALVQFETASIILCGIRIVVACRCVSATFHRTRVEFNQIPPFKRLQSLFEDLDVNLTRQSPFCGDLHHQNPQIVASKGETRLGLREAGESCEPGRTRFVINGNVASKSNVAQGTAWGRDEFRSWINVTGNFGHFWPNGVVCANGQKAVKFQFRKCAEKGGVQSGSIP